MENECKYIDECEKSWLLICRDKLKITLGFGKYKKKIYPHETCTDYVNKNNEESKLKSGKRKSK